MCMKYQQCVMCGSMITKSGIMDPYICRDCERELETMELRREYWLDQA